MSGARAIFCIGHDRDSLSLAVSFMTASEHPPVSTGHRRWPEDLGSPRHTAYELDAFSPLVSVGSYCVVFDTIIESFPSGFFPDRPWDVGNNPKTAVDQFLTTSNEFEVDHGIQERLAITYAPGGFLKSVR